jgi:hypothetical protein
MYGEAFDQVAEERKKGQGFRTKVGAKLVIVNYVLNFTRLSPSHIWGG